MTWDFIDEFRYINIVWFCCDWLAMSNSCYNPFIYGIYNVNICTHSTHFTCLSLFVYAMRVLFIVAKLSIPSFFQEKFKREFRRRFPMFRRSLDTTDMSEKNVSMCTRASSIRSTYTMASTKTKFLIPQRIVGHGSGSTVHHPAHYNALGTLDSARNNNVAKNCGNGCRQWGNRTTWLFNKALAAGSNKSRSTAAGVASKAATTTTVKTASEAGGDWRSSKNIPNCPKVYYNNDHGTTVQLQSTKGASNKNVYFQPVASDITTDDISKKCCCQQYQNNFPTAGSNLVGGETNGVPRRLSNTDLEQLQQQQQQQNGSINGDDDSLSDVDFRKSIIKINNIYNNCRDAGFCNEEKYALVDCHGNAMRLALNEDEVVL